MFKSRDRARVNTLASSGDDEGGLSFVVEAVMGKLLLSERSGNGSHLNLGHMNFVRH